MGDLERSSTDGDGNERQDGFDFEVLDDLEGQDGGYQSSSDDGGEEEAGGTGRTVVDHDMLEDDSIQSFEGHTEAVLSVAWSPVQADLVASGGQDDRAFLWRVGQDAYDETAGSLGTIELVGHSETVAALAFNSTGTLLASGAMDGVVKVWDASTGALKHTLEGPGDAVDWLRWHPRGDVLIAGSEDFTLWMWNAATGVCMQVLAGHRGPVLAGAFTPDGKAIVSVGGEGDCCLRVWNPKTGECDTILQNHPFHEQAVTCLDISADSSVVITGGVDGSVRMSNIQSGRVIGSLVGHEESVEFAGFCKQLPLAATGSVDGKLIIWECGTLTQRSVCEHPAGITRAAWHPTQPLIFTTCLDGIARCWDARTGALVKQYSGHRDGVQDISLSPDGSMFITGSDDHTALIFPTSVQ